MSNNFDFNKLTSLLDTATQSIACGPECQKQKDANQLKNKYKTDGNNLALAESLNQIAKQNYDTFVSIKSSYDEMTKPEYTREAEQFVKKYKKIYNEQLGKIQSQLDNYDKLLINFSNVVDLYKKYKNENDQLFKELKNETNDVLTNERRIYYKDQEMGSSKRNNLYLYIFWAIYIIVVIYFAILYLYRSQISFEIRILLLFVLLSIFILLPFALTWILGKIF